MIKAVKDFFRRRQHPLRILNYTTKYLWLLLIPLGKYLIASQFDFEGWFRSHWTEILTVSLILGYAILRWVSVYFVYDKTSITVHTGFFGIKVTKVNFSEISTFSLNQGYLDRLIHSCTIYIDTGAQSKRRSDISFNLTRKQAFELYHSIASESKNTPKFVYKSRKSDLLAFSFLFSSTLSGMLVIVGVVFQAYRIFGREAEIRILREVNSRIEASAVFEMIPSYILAGAVLIFGMWLISFVANLMRHWNFSCTRASDLFVVRSGKGARRRHVLKRKRINYIDYRQSLLMKIFRVTTVEVGCAGYGKRHREISAIIPITTSSRSDESMRELLPDLPPVRGTVAPRKISVPGFMILPLLAAVIPAIAVRIAYPYFPSYHNEMTITAVLLVIPMFWLMIVKGAAALSTSIGFENGYCTMSFCSWYKFHKVIAPVNKIAKIELTRHIMNRLGGTCTVNVYTNNDKADKHSVKGLPYKETVKLLRENGCLFYEPSGDDL